MTATDIRDLVSWTTSEDPAHGARSFTVHHRLQETGLFNEERLVEMLDRYPRAKLQVFTMGADPEDLSDWQPVDTSGATGRQIYDAVKVGRLWVKLMRIDQNVPAVGELVQRAYGQ